MGFSRGFTVAVLLGVAPGLGTAVAEKLQEGRQVVENITARYDTATRATVRYGDSGDSVRDVQEILSGLGYTITVDGKFGAQTQKVVVKWQKANGLLPDGIVGPKTWATLDAAASASEGADRLGVAEGSQAGSLGLPFAPQGATGCDEMRFYREQFGLPERFDDLAFRESRCRNDVNTYCCYGYWQNYLSSHLSRGSAYRARILAECQADEVSDIFGNDPEQKQKQACVTAVVYSISGYTPWAL